MSVRGKQKLFGEGTCENGCCKGQDGLGFGLTRWGGLASGVQKVTWPPRLSGLFSRISQFGTFSLGRVIAISFSLDLFAQQQAKKNSGPKGQEGLHASKARPGVGVGNLLLSESFCNVGPRN